MAPDHLRQMLSLFISQVEMAHFAPFLLNKCRKLTAFSDLSRYIVQLRVGERGFREDLSRGIFKNALFW